MNLAMKLNEQIMMDLEQLMILFMYMEERMKLVKLIVFHNGRNDNDIPEIFQNDKGIRGINEMKFKATEEDFHELKKLKGKIEEIDVNIHEKSGIIVEPIFFMSLINEKIIILISFKICKKIYISIVFY